MAQAADDELRDAVQAAVRQAQVDHDGARNMVLGEFVIIASAHGFDTEDGEALTQVAIIPRDGSEHRILGLVEHARIRMQADILTTYDDGDGLGG